jgi:hypothetical protein
MANRKISDLTALTTPATGDLLPIVDISEAAAADKNKKITIGELFASIPAGTAAAPSVAFEGDPNTGIYSPGADQVAISTNGTGRLFVDASGNVGVGTGSPLAKQHVSSSYSAATGIDSNIVQLISNNGASGGYAGLGILGGSLGGSFIHFGDADNAAIGGIGYFHNGNYMAVSTNNTERARLEQSGAFNLFSSVSSLYAKTSQAAGTDYATFIGQYLATTTQNGSNSCVIWSNGNIVNSNNSYGALSDVKLKENIADAKSQWADIKSLQVRNYNFKEGQTHTQIGLVAQEAELVSPGLVYESPDRDAEGNDLGSVTKSVNYSVLYMKAVKALQEAMERIEALEASNADMLARVTALEGN